MWKAKTGETPSCGIHTKHSKTVGLYQWRHVVSVVLMLRLHSLEFGSGLENCCHVYGPLSN